MRNRTLPWRLWLVLAITTAGALLAGCGHRGPLYLPEDAGQEADR